MPAGAIAGCPPADSVSPTTLLTVDDEIDRRVLAGPVRRFLQGKVSFRSIRLAFGGRVVAAGVNPAAHPAGGAGDGGMPAPEQLGDTLRAGPFAQFAAKPAHQAIHLRDISARFSQLVLPLPATARPGQW